MWLHVDPGRASLRRSQLMPPKALLCARMLDDGDVGEAKAQRRLWHTRVCVCVFLLCVCRLPPPLQWAQPAEERSPICTCMAHLEFFHSPKSSPPTVVIITTLPFAGHCSSCTHPSSLSTCCCCCCCSLLPSLWLHTFARLFPPHYSLLNPEHNALYPLHLPPTHQPPPLSEELSSVVCIGCSITAAAATKTTHLTTQPPAGTRTLGSTPSFLCSGC